MEILVTGARGKVGAATVHDLLGAGHRVTGCDLIAPVYEGGNRGAHYFQADLTDPGDAFAAVRGADVVIHCAALPEPTRNAPHKVFGNNVMATFNLVEACVRVGVDRIVNVSSEAIRVLYQSQSLTLHSPDKNQQWLPVYLPYLRCYLPIVFVLYLRITAEENPVWETYRYMIHTRYPKNQV